MRFELIFLIGLDGQARFERRKPSYQNRLHAGRCSIRHARRWRYPKPKIKPFQVLQSCGKILLNQGMAICSCVNCNLAGDRQPESI
jgi:hypothetical protein